MFNSSSWRMACGQMKQVKHRPAASGETLVLSALHPYGQRAQQSLQKDEEMRVGETAQASWVKSGGQRQVTVHRHGTGGPPTTPVGHSGTAKASQPPAPNSSSCEGSTGDAAEIGKHDDGQRPSHQEEQPRGRSHQPGTHGHFPFWCPGRPWSVMVSK